MIPERNVWELSLADLAARIRTKEISVLEVADCFLARIDALDGELSAWVTVDPDRVRREARKLDSAPSRGPLHGIPVGIKDIFATAGIKTTMGSPVFRNNVPDSDAGVVRRLKAAGALILGKTVTTEFATLDPGPTRNPWNPSHTPGGSSSGSGAAVASGMCPAATATQTVGSLGRPAAYCGITGILPTASRVSLEGVFPVAKSLDHAGVFARNLTDAMIVLDAMCPAPISVSARSLRPTLGVVREYFQRETEAAPWARHERFIDDLRKAGVRVIDLSLPRSFDAALPAIWTIMQAEVAWVHERIYPEHKEAYGPEIRRLVEAGRKLYAFDYLRALEIRRTYQADMRQLFDSCDVILSPGAAGPAPRGLGSTGKPVLQAPWTLADFPTVSLPLDLTADGLPLGIQLSGPPLGEAGLFGAARWIEEFMEGSGRIHPWSAPPTPSRSSGS